MSVTVNSTTDEIKEYARHCFLKSNSSPETFEALWQDGLQRNESIIQALTDLAEKYQDQGDKFRAMAYKKGAWIIKSKAIPIVSGSFAQKFKGIGPGIAKKIDELYATGGLKLLEKKEDKDEVIKKFMRVWGTGFIQATKWYNLGYRTLKDLESEPSLTQQQRLGIKYYKDLGERIPRAEVEKAVTLMTELLLARYPTLRIEAGGSFRRGEPTSGDIDLIVTDLSKPTEDEPLIDMNDLTDTFHDAGLIYDVLTDGSDFFTGIFKFDGTFRKVDIILAPKEEWATTLLYFGSSQIFNIKLRTLAKSKGYKLNRHGLFEGEKRIPTETEKDVFQALGMEYVPPEKR